MGSLVSRTGAVWVDVVERMPLPFGDFSVV